MLVPIQFVVCVSAAMAHLKTMPPRVAPSMVMSGVDVPSRNAEIVSLLDALVNAAPEETDALLSVAMPMLLYPYRSQARQRSSSVTLNGAHRVTAYRAMLAVEAERLAEVAANYACEDRRERACAALRLMRAHVIAELER